MHIWKWLWGSVTTSFKLKLIGSLFCIILLSFGIAGFYTYESNQRLFHEELSRQAWSANQEAVAKLELKVQEVKRISQILVFNSEIEGMIKRHNQFVNRDTFQVYLEKQNIGELINQLRSDAPYITGLYMLDLSGETIYYRYNTPAIDDLTTNSFEPIRTSLQETAGELLWMQMSLPSEIEPEGYRNTIVAARWMKNSMLQRYGLLIVTIDESFLASELKELMKGDGGKVHLFNRSHELLYSNDVKNSQKWLQAAGENGRSTMIEGELYSRSEAENPLNDSFLLISLRSLDNFAEKNLQIAENMLIAGVLVAVITSVLITLILERLLHPLADLLKGLQRLRSGKFETRIQVRSKDELAYIGESFNAMTEHVENLIKEVYVTQLSEREAELRALQAQLNPHFLHNFFNEIYWKLQLQGEEQSATLIAAASEMLRHSLMPVRIPTTVKEEIRQMDNYIMIQQQLFAADLVYSIEVDEDLLEHELARSLLQPLLENVFLHGFRDKLGGKELVVKIFETDGFLRIDMQDNGCGMDQALITRLLGSKGVQLSDTSRESLGVRSVARRIELLHGPPHRMEIISESGAGTLVSLYLPLQPQWGQGHIQTDSRTA